MSDEEITSQNTTAEVSTEDDYEDYDDYGSYYEPLDYCIFGLVAVVVVLVVWRFCFKKGKFKVSKSGIEFETDNTESEKK